MISGRLLCVRSLPPTIPFFFLYVLVAASCYVGLEKHFLRCRSVPDEIKQKIALARSQHAQQRQVMKLGAQQSFFKRMWDGLQGGTSTTFSDYNDLGVSTTTSIADPDEFSGPTHSESDPKSTKVNAFRDHQSLLDFLHRNNHNKVSAEIEEALDRYYSALDYGGRIYQTDSAMPDHFSAEWLIAKLVPKRGANHALRNVG